MAAAKVSTLTDDQKKKLAACAKAKGATLFGAQWCGYTRRQLDLFGAAKPDVSYVECSEKNPDSMALCEAKGIEAYPTWVVNDKQIRGYMDLETLSKALNCQL